MTTLSRSISALTTLSLCAGAVVPAAAQLSGGPGISAPTPALYDIVSPTGSRDIIGSVLVVPETDGILPDSIMVPKGFEDGAEYWYWDVPKEAYPSAFLIVPSKDTAPPSASLKDYDVFDHDAFDLSAPHLFPKVEIESGKDLTFSVYDYSLKYDKAMGAPLAWFAFEDGGMGDQRAWADKEVEWTYTEVEWTYTEVEWTYTEVEWTYTEVEWTYLPAKEEAGLLFVASALPKPGTIEVVEAR